MLNYMPNAVNVYSMIATEGLDWFGRDGQKWSVGTYVGIGTTNNYLKVSDMYCSYSVD